MCVQGMRRLEPELTRKDGGVLHSAFGASTFCNAKGLLCAALHSAFPLQLCNLSPKLLGQRFPCCPRVVGFHTVVFMALHLRTLILLLCQVSRWK